MIDELDRCRPSYAVALLERVKHLFEVENVVFVFATNADQLRHSVSGAYGTGFDGYRYLKRFFERTYRLDAPNVERFMRVQAENIDFEKYRSPLSDQAECLRQFAVAYEMDLREIKQFAELIGSVATVWNYPFKLDLISTSVVAISYMRNGSIDWSTAAETIPRKFSIRFTQVDHWGTRGEIISLSVATIFAAVQEGGVSLKAAIKLGETENAASERRYAYEVFVPEWDGKPVNHNKKPEQMGVGRLIANAGRLASR